MTPSTVACVVAISFPISILLPSVCLDDSIAGRVEGQPPKGRSWGVEFCAVRPTRAPRASLGTAGSDFREPPKDELRRILLPRTRVHKGSEMREASFAVIMACSKSVDQGEAVWLPHALTGGAA